MYVDDGIIAADEEQTVNLFLKKLESELSVVIGEANYFLGMQIEYLECGKIFIHQEAYCRKILSRFYMINSSHVSTPIEKGDITTDDSISLSADVPYREAGGNLMFLAIVTRPDIAYTVGVLSQVLDKPQQIHWTMVKRILSTIDTGGLAYEIVFVIDKPYMIDVAGGLANGAVDKLSHFELDDQNGVGVKARGKVAGYANRKRNGSYQP
ncbi:retrovirus-related Pol polyprotein from transposon TNT 1-94 [Trichonephila clavipes]|nr:retrovirus-related Pol polyprotein from transposon TNT 1-94 [Trichonephila clavipes]